MREEDTINLWASYEKRLLAHGLPAHTEVPACVVTGFLGSGKTTLLAHLLRNRGGLKIGVLINEVGSVDLDSQLVDVSHVHAAQGLPGPAAHLGQSPLAGGCVCCSAKGGLEQSLTAIRQATLDGLDYLVVETSGVADAEPLAAVLSRHGFRLETVVAVVDAEAGLDVLKLPIAQAQVRCADVVVVNKCDVAGLGSAADVEDEVQRLSPSVRMTRARFGQVPVPLLLDVEVVAPEPSGAGVTGGVGSAECVHGQLGVLSHEAVLSGITGPRYKPAGRLSKLAKAREQPCSTPLPPPGQHPPANHSSSAGAHARESHNHPCSSQPDNRQQPQPHQPHQLPHNHHHTTQADRAATHGQNTSLHSGFHTVSVTSASPISLSHFQIFAAVLTHLPSVYRCKGILWFSELRQHKYIFHLSGRQRAECLRDELWSSAPLIQLVLIGSDHNLLQSLQQCFQQLIASSATAPAAPSRRATMQLTSAVATCLTDLHERLEVVTEVAAPAGAEATDSNNSVGVGLLGLSVRGEPLHGVRGSEVAASILRKAGSLLLPRLGLLALGVPEPPAICGIKGSSTHGVGERITSLQLLLDSCNPFLLDQLDPVPTETAVQPTNTHDADMRGAELPRQSEAWSVYERLGQWLPAGLGRWQEGGGCVPDMGRGSPEGGGCGADVARYSQVILRGLEQCCVPVLRKAFPNAGCKCDLAGVMSVTGHV